MENNATAGSTEGVEEKMSTIATVQVVFVLFICVFGLLGNILVMFVILILKEYKKAVTHLYVLQLAIADSVFLLTLPFQASEELNNAWIYTTGMCKAKEAILFINYYASIMFLVVMSIDRYIAVCHNLSNQLMTLRKQKSAIIIAVCVWIIAILLAIPLMLYSEVAGIQPNCRCTTKFPEEIGKYEMCLQEGLSGDACLNLTESGSCHSPLDQTLVSGSGSGSGSDIDNFGDYLYSFMGRGSGDSENATSNTSGVVQPLAPACHYLGQPKGWKIFLSLNFAIMFLLPFLVMTICYGRILIRISQKKMRSAATRSSVKGPSKADVERKRITKMCAALVITFVVCWVPFHSVHLAKISGIPSDDGNMCVILSVVTSLLAYLNSALNPYLYTILGPGFKKRLTLVKKAPAMKPVVALSVMTKKSLMRSKRQGDSTTKLSEDVGRSSNDLGSSQNPSTMVTKDSISKVDEN